MRKDVEGTLIPYQNQEQLKYLNALVPYIKSNPTNLAEFEESIKGSGWLEDTVKLLKKAYGVQTNETRLSRTFVESVQQHKVEGGYSNKEHYETKMRKES